MERNDIQTILIAIFKTYSNTTVLIGAVSFGLINRLKPPPPPTSGTTSAYLYRLYMSKYFLEAMKKKLFGFGFLFPVPG